MAKKTSSTEKTIKFIKKTIHKYQDVLGLTEINFFVKKDLREDYLSCQFVYPYTFTTINFGESFEKDLTLRDRYPVEELERRIVHEMVHQLTDPIYAKATQRWLNQADLEDERERLTDRIANIVCRLVQK